MQTEYKSLISHILKQYVYFLPCNEHKIQDRIDKLHYVSSSKIVRPHNYQPMVVYVTSAKDMTQTMVTMRKLYNGRVQQMIIGADIHFCSRIQSGIAKWTHASYHQVGFY